MLFGCCLPGVNSLHLLHAAVPRPFSGSCHFVKAKAGGAPEEGARLHQTRISLAKDIPDPLPHHILDWLAYWARQMVWAVGCARNSGEFRSALNNLKIAHKKCLFNFFCIFSIIYASFPFEKQQQYDLTGSNCVTIHSKPARHSFAAGMNPHKMPRAPKGNVNIPWSFC